MVLLALMAGAGITYYLSSQALGNLAKNWLETRLTEAVQTIADNEQFLRRYEITDIVSGVKKAKFDATRELGTIKVGEQGYIFVVEKNGHVIIHPDQERIGSDVSGDAWFITMLNQSRGRLDYAWNGPQSLAVFEYFPPWEWYVVVSDPLDEVYGAITRTRTPLLILAVTGSVLICLLLAFLVRRMIHPLRLLVEGAQKVGHGELETRITVHGSDELGELSSAFNVMAEKLQRNHGELKRSEQHFRSLIENESGIIMVLDADRMVRYISPSLLRVLNYQVDKLIGSDFTAMIHPQDQEPFAVFFHQTLDSPGQNRTDEFRLLHAQGDWRIFEVFSQNLLEDEVVSGIVLNARDITVRKNFEDALKKSEKQLHLLMSQLLEAQEGERKRLSSELHDVVGQNLLFLKFKITQVQNIVGSEYDDLAENCEETLDYIDQIIENVRRLCWDLMPSDLEDLGLAAAVNSLVEDCARHYKLDIAIDLDEIDDIFDSEVQIIVYRLLQESLTNIAKHADAESVRIKGKRESDSVYFIIEDDGVGFDVDKVFVQSGHKRGIGLSAMRERARSVNAELEIKSRSGQGTRISFTIPLATGDHS